MKNKFSLIRIPQFLLNLGEVRRRERYRRLFGVETPLPSFEESDKWVGGDFEVCFMNNCWVLWEVTKTPKGEETGRGIVHGDLPENIALFLFELHKQDNE